MFIDFFYQLKNEGIPVSLHEWITLMEALAKGLTFNSLTGFYYLARSVLVKNEAYFDRYDLAFAKYFKGVETPEDILEQAMDWLQTVISPMLPSLKKNSSYSGLNLEELRGILEDRLKNQKGEHNKGPTWLGKGGTSPVGNSGFSETGIRIGGATGNLTALKVAAQRKHREYRDDLITGVRQFEMALRKLRQLSTRVEGPKDELDLNGTIDATCKNAGWLKLVWERPRRNKLKVILLMDSAGSMDRYIEVCSRLFTAAHRATHFKEIKFFYFHNCVYEDIYKSHKLQKQNSIKTYDFLRTMNSDYRLIIVGDASMAPSEILIPGGAIAWAEFNAEPGQVWLKRLARHFPHSVWLNPVPKALWDTERDHQTVALIREIFPMFELTPQGLEQAVRRLQKKVV